MKLSINFLKLLNYLNELDPYYNFKMSKRKYNKIKNSKIDISIE